VVVTGGTRGTGFGMVRACFLNPGIVVRGLITKHDTDDGSQRVLKILADCVETVISYLVNRILVNDRHGAQVRWLTGPREA